MNDLIEQVPHYETPLIHDGEIVGYPYCIETAVRIFGKEVITEHQGIYQLFYKHSIVYVGMSKNLRKRILYHIQDQDKIFDAVLIYPMPDTPLKIILDIEAEMIKKYTPSLNVSYLCKN
jgi:excinuclease UvrABC nuclease subunit